MKKLTLLSIFMILGIVAFAQDSTSFTTDTIPSHILAYYTHIPKWIMGILLVIGGDIVLQFVSKLHGKWWLTITGVLVQSLTTIDKQMSAGSLKNVVELLLGFLNWVEKHLPSGEIKATIEANKATRQITKE